MSNGEIFSVANAALKVIDKMKVFYSELGLDVNEVLQFEYEKFIDTKNRYAWKIRKQFGNGYVKNALRFVRERQMN